MHITAVRDRVRGRLVGRERELDLVLAAVAAGRRGGLTGGGLTRGGAAPGEPGERYAGVVFDAMVVALSGRIFLDETVDATPEAVLRQIWEDHFILAPAAADPG